MKTNTVISDYCQPYFTKKSVKIPLNFLQGKNVRLAKMAPRRRVCAGGHVTGYFAGGSREGLERARQTQCCSRIIHLAKGYGDMIKAKGLF